MKKDLNRRIDAIFESTNGMQRAQPNSDLFAKIEGQLNREVGIIIPLKRIRVVAAAVIMLLMVNGFALNFYFKKTTTNKVELEKRRHQPSLISDFNLYKI